MYFFLKVHTVIEYNIYIQVFLFSNFQSFKKDIQNRPGYTWVFLYSLFNLHCFHLLFKPPRALAVSSFYPLRFKIRDILGFY
jgi:hypothetical protein